MKNNPIEQSPVITQEILAEFLKLKDASYEAERNYRRVREAILRRADVGTAIEPGPLVLFIEDRETRRFSEANLRQHLGEAEARRLKDLMPSSCTRAVMVFERGRATITDLSLDDLV
jgi:hypothetical protein